MRSRKIQGLAAAIGALVLIPIMSGTALAETNGQPVGKANYLRYDARVGADNTKSDCSTIGFQKVNQDSPIDTNSRALVTNVCEGDYTDAYTRKSLRIDSPAGDVENLSFDVRTADIGAGAPRISVIFANGDVGYLSALYCQDPIAASGGTWSRADFTGDTTDCGFYVNSTFYAADGVSSAWDVYVAANPDQEVSYTFLVFDEPGTYIVDRLSLGTGYLYNTGPKRAVTCSTENDC